MKEYALALPRTALVWLTRHVGWFFGACASQNTCSVSTRSGSTTRVINGSPSTSAQDDREPYRPPQLSNRRVTTATDSFANGWKLSVWRKTLSRLAIAPSTPSAAFVKRLRCRRCGSQRGRSGSAYSGRTAHTFQFFSTRQLSPAAFSELHTRAAAFIDMKGPIEAW
jgi:hypothetical protein